MDPARDELDVSEISSVRVLFFIHVGVRRRLWTLAERPAPRPLSYGFAPILLRLLCASPHPHNGDRDRASLEHDTRKMACI